MVVTVPFVFERKIFRSGRSLRVNIPEEIAKNLDLKAGDTITMYQHRTKIVLQKPTKKWYEAHKG